MRSCGSSTPALNCLELCDAHGAEGISRPHAQQRELDWLTLSAAKYAAAHARRCGHQNLLRRAQIPKYMTPETVNLRYVELSLAQLESKVSVD